MTSYQAIISLSVFFATAMNEVGQNTKYDDFNKAFAFKVLAELMSAQIKFLTSSKRDEVIELTTVFDVFEKLLVVGRNEENGVLTDAMLELIKDQRNYFNSDQT